MFPYNKKIMRTKQLVKKIANKNNILVALASRVRNEKFSQSAGKLPEVLKKIL